MVSHWSLNDRKFSKVSRTNPGILADLNNAIVSMVSTRPLISKSSSPCTNPLVPVPSASITTGITVTLMFHSYFSSLARSRYSSLFSLPFSFTRCSAGTVKSTIQQVLFFLLSLGLVVWLRLDYYYYYCYYYYYYYYYCVCVCMRERERDLVCFALYV